MTESKRVILLLPDVTTEARLVDALAGPQREMPQGDPYDGPEDYEELDPREAHARLVLWWSAVRAVEAHGQTRLTLETLADGVEAEARRYVDESAVGCAHDAADVVLVCGVIADALRDLPNRVQP